MNSKDKKQIIKNATKTIKEINQLLIEKNIGKDNFWGSIKWSTDLELNPPTPDPIKILKSLHLIGIDAFFLEILFNIDNYIEKYKNNRR